MDGITLYCIRNELSGYLPMKVQKIQQPVSSLLVFSLWNRSCRSKLILSLEGGLPFFGFSREKRQNPKTPSGFCLGLRKRLEGGSLTAIRQESLDRVLYLDFTGHDDFGNAVPYLMVFDMAGKGANIGLYGGLSGHPDSSSGGVTDSGPGGDPDTGHGGDPDSDLCSGPDSGLRSDRDDGLGSGPGSGLGNGSGASSGSSSVEGGQLTAAAISGRDPRTPDPRERNVEVSRRITASMPWNGTSTSDPQGRSVEGLRLITAAMPCDDNRFSAGSPYIPPEGTRLDITSPAALRDVEVALKGAKGPALKALISTTQGMGRDLALSVLHQSDVDPDAPLSGEGAGAVARSLANLSDDLREERYRPAIYETVRGDVFMHSLPLAHLQPTRTFSSVLEAAESFRALSLEKADEEALRSYASSLYRKVQKKLESRLSAQLEDLSKAEDADKYRLWGELINSSGMSVGPGASEIEAQDYYQDPPVPVAIPLDPRYSSGDNARNYFARYTKAGRAKKVLQKSTQRLRSQLEKLRAVGEFVGIEGVLPGGVSSGRALLGGALMGGASVHQNPLRDTSAGRGLSDVRLDSSSAREGRPGDASSDGASTNRKASGGTLSGGASSGPDTEGSGLSQMRYAIDVIRKLADEAGVKVRARRQKRSRAVLPQGRTPVGTGRHGRGFSHGSSRDSGTGSGVSSGVGSGIYARAALPRNIQTLLGPGGSDIYVGGSARANDYLVSKVKKPGDIWFHAKGTKGAHVLLRPPPSTEPSDEMMLAAARIAGENSQASGATKVEVDIVDAMRVRKPRGGAPGFVTYTGQKTVVVSLT